jgi:hypothetical protein
LSETELNGYIRSYPGLNRFEVLHAIVSAGPWRSRVEEELSRLAAHRRKAAMTAPLMKSPSIAAQPGD